MIRGQQVPEHVMLVLGMREAGELHRVLEDARHHDQFPLNEYELEIVDRVLEILTPDEPRGGLEG